MGGLVLWPEVARNGEGGDVPIEGGVEEGEGEHTNCVDGLMDHDLAEFKFLVLRVADVLGDHGGGFIVRIDAVAPTIRGMRIIVVCVEGAKP